MHDILRILNEPGSVLLDSSEEVGEQESGLLFSSPKYILSCDTPSEVPGMLAELDDRIRQGYFAAGYLAYECGYAFTPGRFEEQANVHLTQRLGYPIFWFGIYERPDRVTSDHLIEAFDTGCEDFESVALFPRVSRVDYLDRISTVKSLIHEGDVYQINFTTRFDGKSDGDAFDLYAAMRSRQPVSYAAFIQLGEVQLLSASPECFFSRSGDRIRSQPMKGTAPRGQTPSEDKLLSEWLRLDEKSRAENLMIVDLLRNDLSMVCKPGSVKVPSLFHLERYRTVLQMTSTVEGSLKEEIEYSDIFRALFPCGSITGAPKIRSMRRISELEADPRGVYCGTIGYITPEKTASFSVSIRSLSLTKGGIVFGSGGGIIWDSEENEEYEECLLKASFLTGETGSSREKTKIIETMLWEDGISLLEAHLERLEATAVILDFRFERSDVRRVVSETVERCRKGGRYKIRLLMGVDGRCEASVQPLPGRPSEPLSIGIATVKVNSDDPFLRVKTTRRTACERAAREADEHGLDEILLLNERGRVTEGTVTNVFVLHDGIWRTPPVSDGLLPGLGRSHLLKTLPGVIEESVTTKDLNAADEILLTNAVWGDRRAVLASNV